MKFYPLDVEGAHRIELERHTDERGFFARMFCTDELSKRGLNGGVSQVNTGFSPRAGTLRGMHFQAAPHAEVKIVRCLRGAAYDVVVDLRQDSPSYCRWAGVTLTAEDGTMVYAPEGCAHGYLTLEPDTELMYFTSAPYAPAAAGGVRHDDPAFGIEWPREIELISAADRSWPGFER